MAEFVLHDYWRSSASYRVRIALNLKGIAYEQRSVHLAEGRQREPGYRAINAQGLVPTLEHDGRRLTQSLAICAYLDAITPEPRLRPAEPVAAARVDALAQLVAMDIHPLNNLRVLKYLKGPLAHSPEAVDTWYRHWVAEGFEALELRLSEEPETGRCCHGDEPTLADVALIPQVYNAERFDCDLDAYPTIRRVTAHCRALPAFAKAAPEAQPDAA